MAMKRTRDAEDNGVRALSKRAKVNPDLVRIWERLADDSEETRLEAAYDLISNHFASANADSAQKLLERLFRGLCSGRKSARPGFYTALIGVLSHGRQHALSLNLSSSKVLSILEAQTTAEAETSKQDERDHYFGRLLGIKAIIESGLLLQASDDQWNTLLDDLFGLMASKPWLRVEASVVACSSVPFITQDKQKSEQRLVQMLKQLKKHKLTRTSDGLSIWLIVKDLLPKSKLPQDSWKMGNPLNPAELQSLRRTLLDSKHSQDNYEGDDLTGTSVWSPRLNTAWHYIIARLGQKQEKHEISFEEFWTEVIDNGVFSPASTPERKTLGFLMLRSALENVSPSHFRICFSQNLMATVTQALRNSDEAYLRKTIDTVFNDVKHIFETQRKDDRDELIKAFLLGSGLVDFDTMTKTKFVQSLFEPTILNSESGLGHDLLTWLVQLPDAVHGVSQSAARRNLLSTIQRAIEARILLVKKGANESETITNEVLVHVTGMLSKLVALSQNKEKYQLDEDTIALIVEKTTSILESLVAIGSQGIAPFFDVVRSLKSADIVGEDNVKDAVKTSWKNFSSYRKKAQKSKIATEQDKSDKVSTETAFAALLGLNLLEVYSGDTDAAEMLDELNAMATDFSSGKQDQVADNIIDTLMSFLSKPSKLNRRIGNLAFSGFAPQISVEGLKTLTDLITTKETREGQQALFEHDGDLADEADTSDDDEGLDSDVEVLEASGSDAQGSADEQSDEDTDSNSSSNSDTNDDELTSFESALAAALGTRKFTEADLDDAASDSESSSSGSDSDMSDSEMMQLDDKLAEVFRNQANQASAQKQRKEELKNVKENAVNLKNRAMDLIEIFLRIQQSRGMECVALLTALLEMAKETATQQLATRGLEMAKSYVQKCKGAKLPSVPEGGETRDVLESYLTRLYGIIYSRDVSNVCIEVAAQINILLCKLLSRAGEKDVLEVVARISSPYGKRTEIKRKALQEFWSRFDTWAIDTKQKQATPQEKQTLAKASGKGKKAKS